MRLAVLFYIVCTLLAAQFYPGGTQWNSLTVGFDWRQNFLSDLGNTFSYSGLPNLYAMLLFIAAQLSIVVAVGRCLYGQAHEHLGMLRPVLMLHVWALACIAATPFNLLPMLHHAFVAVFLISAGVLCVYGPVVFSHKGFRYLLLTFLFITAIALYMYWESDWQKQSQVLPQKYLAVILLCWYLLMDHELRLTQTKPDQNQETMSESPASDIFAYDLWYMAMASGDLKKGQTKRKIILNQAIVFARRNDGEVFAMEDRCPHRGMPLSYGPFDGEHLSCAYHGWCFNSKGTCSKIPALTEHDQVDVSKIKTPTYHIEERNGLIFVFIAEAPEKAPEEKPAFMKMPYADFDGEFFRIDNPSLPCDIDNACFGLLDPAHVPFVHKSWWWRSKAERKMKEKPFQAWELGFQMMAHTPSANSKGLKAIGGNLETEITFQLPGYRIECIRSPKHENIALTCLTPINEKEVEFTQFLYFPKGHYLNLFKWVLRYLGRGFMAQDVDAFTKQAEGNRAFDKMMYVGEVDRQGKWYFQVKKAYMESRASGEAFKNPVEACSLRWYT